MDFSSSVRFWEKTRVWFSFGSVLKNRPFGFLCRSVVKYKKKHVSCLSCVCILHFGRRFSKNTFLKFNLNLNLSLYDANHTTVFVRMAQILTICMRQVQFWETPQKPKFRVWPFGFGSVQVNRNRTEIRFPHIPRNNADFIATLFNCLTHLCRVVHKMKKLIQWLLMAGCNRREMDRCPLIPPSLCCTNCNTHCTNQHNVL